MDYQLIMDTAILAGEIMLKSGGETHRVEETINYILNTSGADRTEAFAIMTGVIASMNVPGMETITVIRKVKDRNTDLGKVDQVNTISRKLCCGEMELEDAYEALGEIEQKKFSKKYYIICTVLVTAGFALLHGGGAADIIAAGLNGMILALLMRFCEYIGISSFFQNVIASFGVACSAIIWYAFLSMNVETVIISSLVPLFPGVAITNAVRDTLDRDYISGGAGALEAVLKAASTALGAGLAIGLLDSFLGGRTLWF